MMTCKEVSTLVSMGEVESAPTVQRIAVWLHLAMCRHCRAFRRQIAAVARAARIVSAAFEAEPSANFEGRITHRLAVIVLCLLGFGLAVRATPQTSPPPARIDVQKLGPQVGQRVPDFALKDQTGKVWTLQSIMGPKGAMLVFYRSADWCPYCKTELIDLQSRVKDLQAQGYGLAAISYDPVTVLADFSARRGITFPLLSDAGSTTIKAYGILNPVPEEALGPNKDDPAVAAEIQRYVSVVRPTAAMVGIAFPGTFIVDRQGRVTSRFFEESYIERNTVASILTRVNGATAPVAATKISIAHLEMTTYGSDATVAAGNRFSLSVNIAPHRGVHVYAPGASGYRIVELKLGAQPFLKVLPANYPASEIYHFKPLDERVPVYQKPFTLVQDVVLDGALSSQAAYRGKESITIAGTLEYQACDDKICFNPAAVPVSWTVALRPLDTQRAIRP